MIHIASKPNLQNILQIKAKSKDPLNWIIRVSASYKHIKKCLWYLITTTKAGHSVYVCRDNKEDGGCKPHSHLEEGVANSSSQAEN